MAYHHGDLRRALLQGALEILAEGGPSRLTMRAAAQRAGVSAAAPYRHFADKRAMLAAVAEEGFLALERACVASLHGDPRGTGTGTDPRCPAAEAGESRSAAVAGDSRPAGSHLMTAIDPIECFWRRGVAYVKFAIENPAHYRVMFGPEIPDKRAYEDLHRAAMAAYDGLRSTLRACTAAGYFAEDEIEPRAMRAWGLVHGLASLFIDGQLNVNDETLAREDFLVRVGEALGLELRVLENGSGALPRGKGPAV